MSNRQKETDEAIIDHLDRTNPDAEVRENYWRKQYEKLVEHNAHDFKERKRMNVITNLICYTIYICNIAWTVEQLCSYDAERGWDSLQRFLWCLVLAMNVGFAVFVAMSRLIMKMEKERMDRSWKNTQTILELKAKLDVAEHNLEVLKEEKAIKSDKITPVKGGKSTKSDKKSTN